MSWRKHTYSQSLTSKETTQIRNLTKDILIQERLKFIPVKIKSGVWSTAFITSGTQDRLTKEYKVKNQYIQFGGKMLTGSMFPKRIYYISLYDPDYRVVIIKHPRDIMLADIVASTILEEVAHAIVFNDITVATYKKVKVHGREFIDIFRYLWKKYFITLKYRLQRIYGFSGFSAEDLL